MIFNDFNCAFIKIFLIIDILNLLELYEISLFRDLIISEHLRDNYRH